MNFLAQQSNETPVPVLMPGWQLIALAVFGLVVLGVFAWIRVKTADTEMGYSYVFSRTIGLITIAILGVVLAVASAPTDVKTAAFTLLGTIAGFFITEKGGGTKPGPKNGEQQPDSLTVNPIPPEGGGASGTQPERPVGAS